MHSNKCNQSKSKYVWTQAAPNIKWDNLQGLKTAVVNDMSNKCQQNWIRLQGIVKFQVS